VEGDYAALSQHPDVRAEVASAIDEVNSKVNRWETIKDFRVLDHDLTIEGGELTPSLKVKRRVVEDTNRALLDEMYPTA
jgi:long-chain acyl-CoA synthetase